MVWPLKFLYELLFMSLSRLTWNLLSLMFLELMTAWPFYVFWIGHVMNQRRQGGKVWKDLVGPLMGECRVGFPYKKRNIIFSAWRSYTQQIGRSYYLWKWCSQLRIILLNLTPTCTISSLWKEQKQVRDNMVISAELPLYFSLFFPSLPFSFLFWSLNLFRTCVEPLGWQNNCLHKMQLCILIILLRNCSFSI